MRVVESVKMTAKEEFKAVRDSWARTRDIVIDSLTVGSPQSVKSHRMASLKTIAIAATQKSRTTRRPGIKSLLQRNRLRETERVTKIRPDLLCEGTVVNEVTESLNRRASMTKELFRGEMKDAVAKRKCILEQLVPRLPMPRKER